MLFAGLTLASCAEISTDPAPTRLTRTQIISVSYSLTAAPILPTDTTLVNPKLEVYLINPAVQSDGSVFYPLVATGPIATITNFSSPQPIAVGSVTLNDGQPAPIMRYVFSSDNLPGRKATAQKITASLFVNSVSRNTTSYGGLDFARRTATPAPAAPFRKQTDLSVAIY